MISLQILGLILMVAGFCFKEWLDHEKDRTGHKPLYLCWLYRGAVITGICIGAFGTIAASVDKVENGEKVEALKMADEGRSTFHDGLTSNSTARIDSSFEKLDRAVDQLRKYPDLGWQLLVALHDRALGNERVSYGGSARGCLYFHDGERIDSCWVREGSKIYVNPPTFGYLRCTDVEQPELWASTRKYYSQLEQELAAFRGHDVSNQHYAADVVAAARSAGYFRFCDLARNQQGDPNVIRDDWALALQTAQNMPTRKKELDDKLKFLPALSSSNTDLSCQRECSLDEEAHPIPASMVIEGGEYYEWRFDSNRPLKEIELDNTNRKTGNGISLAVCNQPECTGQVHAVLTRKAAIREAIATWDVSTPPGSSIDIYMTPRIDGKWDSPLLVAHWSSDRAVKTSVNSSSEHARIATDTLVVSHPDGADAIRLSLKLHSTPAAASPLVRSIGLSVSGRDAPIVEDLDVPTISQMAQPDGDKKCSPTSVAMLTGYWASKSPGAWSPTTSDVIDGVFDPAYGWGNWSFNVAYVNSASNGTMRAFVTRLRSLDELATLVTSGVPVVASLRWEKGEMTGAAIERTDGHLLLVRGIDPKGDIVVNDPRDEGKQIRRTYLRSEFRRAWRHSHNTVYIVVPSTSNDEYIKILSRIGIRRDWP